MSREFGAGARGRVWVRFDGHGGDVGGAHEGPAQRFDAVVDVRAEDRGGDVEPGGRGGVGREVGVLADHVLGGWGFSRGSWSRDGIGIGIVDDAGDGWWGCERKNT